MYQIQFNLSNYEDGDKSYVKKFKNKEEYDKFLNIYGDLLRFIIKNIDHTHWNWWSRIPDKWDGEKFVTDYFALSYQFKEHFGEEYSNYKKLVELFKELEYKICAGRIKSIKAYKTEEIEI